MSAFGYSYLRINPRHVTATAWSQIDAGVERDLPPHFESWEHSVDLHLLRRIRVDFDAIASDLALDPETLTLEVSVTAATGGLRGDRRRELFWQNTVDRSATEVTPEFVLLGEGLSQAVSLRTMFLLRSPLGAGSALSPKFSGQRLWEDWRLTTLEPVGPRFRIDPVSFITEFPDAPTALWRLEWSPEDPARDFTGSVRLLINSDNADFVRAFSGNDEIVTRLVMTDIISQITRGVLANPAFSPETDEPTSIGAAVSGWIERAFPGQSTETVSEMMARDPARFEAALAGLVDA